MRRAAVRMAAASITVSAIPTNTGFVMMPPSTRLRSVNCTTARARAVSGAETRSTRNIERPPTAMLPSSTTATAVDTTGCSVTMTRL